jgi:pyruvate formate-lyase activating enzyme-like uncharacterized protein
MAKPIFLVGVPVDFQPQTLQNIQQMLEDKIQDYHTLVYTKKDGDEIDFKALYEKDFDEIKFEQLKELVKSNAR